MSANTSKLCRARSGENNILRPEEKCVECASNQVSAVAVWCITTSKTRALRAASVGTELACSSSQIVGAHSELHLHAFVVVADPAEVAGDAGVEAWGVLVAAAAAVGDHAVQVVAARCCHTRQRTAAVPRNLWRRGVWSSGHQVMTAPF